MRANYIIGFLFLIILAPLQAATPLVDVDWLMVNLNKPNLIVLDLQPKATYQRFHITRAVNSDYSEWRKPDVKKTPGMIPSISALEQLIGGLGIDNETQVILVVTGRGASEMASATRVYWTFKALGHDKVSILDGGLIAYGEARKNPIESNINTPDRKTFKANPRPDYLVTADEIKGLLGT